MHRAVPVLVACLSAMALPIPAPATAQARLDLVELESRIFGNTRLLRIWLPPGYDAPENRTRVYPVLYLNDGQNLFDAETAVSGGGEWQVDETSTALIEAGETQPFVVVGIDNNGLAGRAREYLPYPDVYLDPPEPDPQGSLYDDFLEEEVLPLVEARYRVARDADGRALGGSSYGALAALYVALERPHLFARLLLESPSFYVDDDHVLRDARQVGGLALTRAYLGVGTNETGRPGCSSHPDNDLAVQGVRQLADVLGGSGLTEGETLMVVVEPCATHNEAAWAARLPAALRFLFGR